MVKYLTGYLSYIVILYVNKTYIMKFSLIDYSSGFQDRWIQILGLSGYYNSLQCLTGPRPSTTASTQPQWATETHDYPKWATARRNYSRCTTKNSCGSLWVGPSAAGVFTIQIWVELEQLVLLPHSISSLQKLSL